MWGFDEVLRAAREMGLDVIWGRLVWGHTMFPDNYATKGQTISIMTKKGRHAFSFKCLRSGIGDDALLHTEEQNPFTHRMMCNRVFGPGWESVI